MLPNNSPNVVQIEPCYQWAQNMTHTFIRFKFSRRMDSPGIMEINRVNVTFTMPELFLEAYSFEGDYPIKFYIKIKTYKFLNPQGCRWSLIGQGQLDMELLKSPSPYVWRNLHADVDYKPSNMNVWWEIYYKYKENMERGFALLEATDMQRDEKQKKKLENEDQQIQNKKNLKNLNKQYEQMKMFVDQQRIFKYDLDYKNQYGNVDIFEWGFWVD
ncbi:HSP20-like chaperone [Pseudocohnilembus persalinus]|uniref:HSP20-like chaperone n=1 Tax=Pseudocohnilembus persalinus TaxID=266149 RepID=A0A0V0R225_PSEPJ|nr:HSP20-like chaperone [Pseudocohnilembus persalinus]|eukprot:KRX08320.1 HSP20-like chaperone [Pseudocohnilembus persalinus]